MKGGELAHGPRQLPDGEVVLFTLATSAGSDGWDKAQIVAQSPDASTRKVLIVGGSDARYLPTGHLVYAVSGSLFAVPFDPQRLEVIGAPTPVVEGVRRATAGTGNSATTHVDVSAIGALIYLPGPRSAPFGRRV